MFEDDELNPQEQNENGLDESLDSNMSNQNEDLKEIKEMTSEIVEGLAKQPVPDSESTHEFENADKDFSSFEPETIVENEFDEETPVTVQPVRFTSFDEEQNKQGKENKNLNLLMNVNLQMSVELGRTELPFKKVLELTRGSIVSLDKLAGEPVELYANGKLVAYGEVVVIEDNFGLRITSIAAPEERLKSVSEDI